MEVKMIIQFGNEYLELPINPKNIQPSQSISNTNIDLVGIGKATRKGAPGLLNFTIDSFFPGENSYYFVKGKTPTPHDSIAFIKKIIKTENINNNVPKLIVYGLPIGIDMYFVIDDFKYKHEAGDEEDVWFTLKIKRYIPYGAKIIDAETLNKLTNVRANNYGGHKGDSSESLTNNTQKTYTVIKGDCLWNITKKYTGSGKSWRDLYDLNKSKISNPNLIYPGQVLLLPLGW